MSMSSLPFASMGELRSAYRAGELSPVDVTTAMLERIA